MDVFEMYLSGKLTPGQPVPQGRSANPWSVTWKTAFVDWSSKLTDRRKRLGHIRGLKFTSPAAPAAPAHSHPEAAAQRSAATKFLSTVAATLGKRRFDVSMSPRERQMSNTAGTRQFRGVKDLLVEPHHDKLLPDDFVTMVDTDYYMTEQEFSNFAGHDIGLYALQPNGLSGSNKESTWRFADATTVQEEVAGGARYRHQVWDWKQDVLVLKKGFRTYIYDPVVFDVGPERVCVVLLLARVLYFPGFVARMLMPDLSAYCLRRMAVVKQGSFLVATFGTASKKEIQVLSLSGTSPHVAVSPGTFEALAIASTIPNADRKVTKFELPPAAVERLVRQADAKVSSTGCYLLSKYFSTSYSACELTNYQCTTGLKLEDGIPTVRLAAVPLAGAGCGPTSSANNEARAIKARVTDVRNTTSFPDDLRAFGKEFADLVVRKPGVGVPWSAAELATQQDTPAQRARRLAEERFTPDHSPKLKTTSFQKKESYAKPGDPRLINQVPTDHTNRLGSYSGAIKVLLKGPVNSHWYSVGKKPAQLASGLSKLFRSSARKAGIAPDAQVPKECQLVGGDYSRMDGRTSADYRKFVLQPIYLRYFSRRYHPELIELLSKEIDAKTHTRQFGISADMGGANLSGSGITTDLNTCDSAFNEYAARRRAGESPSLAFANLGMYFGDDSVTTPEIFDQVVSVASECGMKLSKEPVPEDSGPGYVSFLSRVYPDIQSSQVSHPVMRRALKKLCMVTASSDCPEKTLKLKLAYKARSVLVNDQHVPVLADYAQALIRVYGLNDLRASEREWEAQRTRDVSYKLSLGAYPTDGITEQLMFASVAEGLGVSVEEAMNLSRKLVLCETEADLAALQLEGSNDGLPDWATWVPIRGV